jgi:hypothetical protein
VSGRLSSGASALIENFVSGFEGLLSAHPNDNGNWYDPARFKAGLGQKRGMGRNVGSMRGVTAYALVNYRLAKGWSLERAVVVTRADMLAIDLPTAIDIGVVLFYAQPGLRHLAWNRVTASILDKAWGSGPGSAKIRLQREIGASPDGQIGKGGETASLYSAWIGRLGEVGAARRWAEVRRTWDAGIASNEGPKDPDRIFLPGWNRRTDSFLPGTEFWRDW